MRVIIGSLTRNTVTVQPTVLLTFIVTVLIKRQFIIVIKWVTGTFLRDFIIVSRFKKKNMRNQLMNSSVIDTAKNLFDI